MEIDIFFWSELILSTMHNVPDWIRISLYLQLTIYRYILLPECFESWQIRKLSYCYSTNNSRNTSCRWQIIAGGRIMTGHTARSVSSQQEERPEFESLCWLVPFCFVGLQVLWFFFCTSVLGSIPMQLSRGTNWWKSAKKRQRATDQLPRATNAQGSTALDN